MENYAIKFNEEKIKTGILFSSSKYANNNN